MKEVMPLLKELMRTHFTLSLHKEISIEYADPFKQTSQAITQAKRWHALNLEYFSIMEKLTKLGIFVKDAAVGLIDFYSKHEGREIFLCYRYPEERIEFWHELNDGFPGRQSIEILKKTG